MYPYDRRRSYLPAALLVGSVLFLVLAVFQLSRGLPAIAVATTVPASTRVGAPVDLPLPAEGSVVAAVDGLGTIAAANATTARPIASVTKMMTAYVILKDHPLQPGEAGPTLTFSAADADRYVQMIGQDQSALPVRAGQELSEYQMLEGMLVPSANNFAEILAAWDAGSVEAFVTRMNAEAKALGMTGTSYADTSGFSPDTVSTAADQLILARTVIANPVFAAIVALPQVELPEIGVVPTTNEILGENGVVGIKTGFTEEAGANLAFAANATAGETQLDIIGVVLGQPDRPASFSVSADLIGQLASGVGEAKIIVAGSAVGSVDPAWGDPVDIVVSEDVQMLYWPGMTLSAQLELDDVKAPLAKGHQVGWLDLQLGEQTQRVPVVLADDLSKPGLLWRLSRS